MSNNNSCLTFKKGATHLLLNRQGKQKTVHEYVVVGTNNNRKLLRIDKQMRQSISYYIFQLCLWQVPPIIRTLKISRIKSNERLIILLQARRSALELGLGRRTIPPPSALPAFPDLLLVGAAPGSRAAKKAAAGRGDRRQRHYGHAEATPLEDPVLQDDAPLLGALRTGREKVLPRRGVGGPEGRGELDQTKTILEPTNVVRLIYPEATEW